LHSATAMPAATAWRLLSAGPSIGAMRVRGGMAETAPTQRDRHLRCITEKGRMAWQQATGYNKRAKAEMVCLQTLNFA
jgi:hypothetical protein